MESLLFTIVKKDVLKSMVNTFYACMPDSSYLGNNEATPPTGRRHLLFVVIILL